MSKFNVVRFNIEDRVKVLCLDDMSNNNMIQYIGQTGTIVAVDEEENETSYGVSFENDNYDTCWWFRESSLEFEGRKFLVNTDEVLHIITNAREDYPEARDILDKIIYKISGLLCK